jgi:ribosomal protein S18 acetylase RimI-like enzyme
MPSFSRRRHGPSPVPNAPDVMTRAVLPADAGFLLKLFAASRTGPWSFLDDAAGGDVLRLQFSAQQADYLIQFPNASHRLVLMHDEPVGQVRWVERATDVLIIDISLLEQYRRQGIGSAIYRDILARAHAGGRRVAASVARSNLSSLAFHQRLGFVVDHEGATHYSLRA